MELEWPKKVSFRKAGLLAIAVLVSACTQNGATTGAQTTVTLMGTLTSMATVSQSVTVTGNGEMDVQLSAIAPQTTITVGLGIGQTSNSQCALLSYSEAVKVGTVLSAIVAPGTYCIAVYDVGNVVGSDTFTVTVASPT